MAFSLLWRPLYRKCEVNTVFPVPGFPAIKILNPLGIPPSIKGSRPKTPVEIRDNAKFYKVSINKFE